MQSVTIDLSSLLRHTGRGCPHLQICLSNLAKSMSTCHSLAPGSSFQGKLKQHLAGDHLRSCIWASTSGSVMQSASRAFAASHLD